MPSPAGAKAIANNRSLIRAIHFPRAVLPLAVIVQEIQQQIVSLVILCGIVFLTGEPITWHWLGADPGRCSCRRCSTPGCA